MKKIFTCFLLLILLVGLTACGESKTSDDVIRADIASLQNYDSVISQNYINYTPYVLKDYKITKRQTNIDKKEDIIFCDVTVENESFSVLLKEKLTYAYYDQGGWMQEKYEILEKNIKAIAPPEDVLVCAKIMEKTYHADKCWLIPTSSGEIDAMQYRCSKIELDEKEQVAYAKYTFISPVLTVDGYYKLICDPQNGWRFEPDGKDHTDKTEDYPQLNIENYTADYSNMIGAVYKCTALGLSIKIINITDTTITYDLISSRNTETKTSKFYPLNGSISNVLYYGYGNESLSYSSKEDMWGFTWGSYHGFKRIQ